MTCAYCERPVDPASAFRRVRGWEHKSKLASRRSGSDILLRERLDEWCCSECMTRLRAGLSPTQAELL